MRALVAALACLPLSAASVVAVAPSASAAADLHITGLRLATTGTVTHNGLATIDATVTCNAKSDLTEFFLDLEQRVHGLHLVVSEDGDVPGCSRRPTTFSMQVEGQDSGNMAFVIKPGHVTVSAEVFVCDASGDSCDYRDAGPQVVRLHRVQ